MANGWGGRRPGAGRKRIQDARTADAAPFNATPAIARVQDADRAMRKQWAQDGAQALVDTMDREEISAGKFADAATDERINLIARSIAETSTASEARKTRDAAISYPFQLGLGSGIQNQLSSMEQGFSPLTRIWPVLAFAYRGNFLCKQAVDAIPVDATREGARIVGDLTPEECERIEAEVLRLKIYSKLQDGMKSARLYGGSIVELLIQWQEPQNPLRLETIGKQQFCGLRVIDRPFLEPSLQRICTDITNPSGLGWPETYTTTDDFVLGPRRTIHNTRCIRLSAGWQPSWTLIQENLWGVSVLETAYDRLMAYNLATASATNLVRFSYLRTVKVDGLRSILAEGGQGAINLEKYFLQMARLQNSEAITLLDKNDEFHDASSGNGFSGLDLFLDQLGRQCSGALGIPMTRLFGIPPAGLNATGESDMRNYYDSVRSLQRDTLLEPLTLVYRLVAESIGIKWKNSRLVFNPLWQLQSNEKSEVAAKNIESILSAFESGAISLKTALQELKEQSIVTGVMSNITGDDIEAAKDTPAPEPVSAPEPKETTQ
jgi:phage-related protein (TIGR01555 family)